MILKSFLNKLEKGVQGAGFLLSFQKEKLILELTRLLEEKQEGLGLTLYEQFEREITNDVEYKLNCEFSEKLRNALDVLLYRSFGISINDLKPLEKMDVEFSIKEVVGKEYYKGPG